MDEKDLVVVGIAPRGSELAKELGRSIENLSGIKIRYCTLKINKDNPTENLACDLPLSELENKSIVVVDDVLNTGSTLIYAVRHFLKIPVKQIKTAVMVNRNHKKFPIKADFKGISLSTSTNEHVSVILKGADSGIYLR
jgi:pyrimidine operon attenuation protein/uracil phosphoribosyltransferase